MFNCVAWREEHCKQISLACVGSVRSVWTTLGLPQLTACMLSWSILLRLRVALQGNAKVGTGFRALPRLWEPKLFRFRFLGTPQSHRLGWACVLCPSHIWAVQVTKCLASAHSPVGAVHLTTSPVPASEFPWLCSGNTISGVACVSSGELISGCDSPCRC